MPDDFEETLDFGYIFCRVMRFYAMTHQDVMALPMKTFWLMSDCIVRLSAESEMRQLSVMTASQQGGEAVTATMQRLSAEIGLVVLQRPERDVAGLEQLKLMM